MSSLTEIEVLIAKLELPFYFIVLYHFRFTSFMTILYSALLLSTFKSIPTDLRIALPFCCCFFFIFSSWGCPLPPPQIKIRHNFRFGCPELLSTAPVYYVLSLHISQRHAYPGIVLINLAHKLMFWSTKKQVDQTFYMRVLGFFLPKIWRKVGGE